jgi:hypothetical protein
MICLARPVEEPTSPIHPKFDDRLLIAIDRALRTAWRRLLSDGNGWDIVATNAEPKITECLRKQLNHVRTKGGAQGYDCDHFDRPHVGSEYLNYKGVNIGKPDLIFSLCGKPRPGVIDDDYDAIFVECKLIDEEKGGKNFGHYCGGKGMMRFVNGSYGWRMPHGMMVAYVRTDQTLPAALDEGFSKFGRAVEVKVIGRAKLCPLSQASPRTCLSEHRREWLLPEGVTPGPIQIRHLWLNLYKP